MFCFFGKNFTWKYIIPLFYGIVVSVTVCLNFYIQHIGIVYKDPKTLSKGFTFIKFYSIPKLLISLVLLVLFIRKRHNLSKDKLVLTSEASNAQETNKGESLVKNITVVILAIISYSAEILGVFPLLFGGGVPSFFIPSGIFITLLLSKFLFQTPFKATQYKSLIFLGVLSAVIFFCVIGLIYSIADSFRSFLSGFVLAVIISLSLSLKFIIKEYLVQKNNTSYYFLTFTETIVSLGYSMLFIFFNFAFFLDSISGSLLYLSSHFYYRKADSEVIIELYRFHVTSKSLALYLLLVAALELLEFLSYSHFDSLTIHVFTGLSFGVVFGVFKFFDVYMGWSEYRSWLYLILLVVSVFLIFFGLTYSEIIKCNCLCLKSEETEEEARNNVNFSGVRLPEEPSDEK